MSDFQVGDIVRWRLGDTEQQKRVVAIYMDYLWLTGLDDILQPFTYYASGFEKVPKTFEVGKTYRADPTEPGNTQWFMSRTVTRTRR
jgi:hypothetical protein